ncbi:MAG TPA: hypothetical protein VE553_01965, partial [Candidatus Binatia bacterium]|nr:hypothetical protein [Candidatus Binatia bacterium]
MSNTPLSRLEMVATLGLVLLAASLPYEIVVFSAGPLQVSNLELLLALVLVCTAALVVRQRRWEEADWLRFPRSWLALWAVVAVVMLLSAVTAPEYRLNAAKASARFLYGMALALCTPQIVRRRNQML